MNKNKIRYKQRDFHLLFDIEENNKGLIAGIEGISISMLIHLLIICIITAIL